jgi:leucine dehydrogenase
MNPFELARQLGHEEIVILRLGRTGLRAVIAIHDTTLGPAVGGTRMRPYASFDDAITDALRLSRAMTYKAAMADMAWGGAKAVIPADPSRDKTPAFYAAYAEALDRLGRFQTGGDMGIDAGDVGAIARLTSLMSHTPGQSSVDASDLTAIGVMAGLQAATASLGCPLAELHVALQGLGEVGGRLARRLAAQGVRLTVADVVPARVERVVAECGAHAVLPEAIYDVRADVFSPCAAGGILNQQTIPRLRCRAVVGAANEQLLEPRDGEALSARGILYAPDYLVNAGGLLSLLFERGETDEAGIIERVENIGPRLASLWEQARGEGVPPQVLADRLVEAKLARVRRW